MLGEANANIRALGSPTSGKTVHVDYTMKAANTFLESLVPQLKEGQPFRFIYTSGGLVPYLDSPLLFFLGSIRKVRVSQLLLVLHPISRLTRHQQGVLDRDLLAMEDQNPGKWETFVARPWYVVDEPPMISHVLSNSYIFRKELGAAMVDAALNSGDKRLLPNGDLRAKGQAALAKQA